MKCPKCQADNPDGSEFCSLCFTRFQVQLRSQEIDETARRMQERSRGSKLCCPSCRSMSPLNSQFCLKCGFVFEDLESLLVSDEEIARIVEAAEGASHEGDLLAPPVELTPESNGAEVMRSLGYDLDRGLHPRIHAHGRNAVTYAMKIVALLGEDLREKGLELRFKANLISEGPVTHLDDVGLEIVLESV
jgi:hypothetical protein